MKKILYIIALIIPLVACDSDPQGESPDSTAEQDQGMAQDVLPNDTQSVAQDTPQTEVSLSHIWELEGLRTPESVLYHEGDNGGFLFVAEIEGQGDEADGEGGIAKLSLEGEFIDQDWARGLDAPKGMGVHEGKLYVADITKVAVIDIASQQIESRIDIADSKFLNDITIDDNGAVFVSDTHTGKIHRIVDGAPEIYLEDIEAANGLTAINDDLYIAAGSALWKADADRQLTKVAEGLEENADGVEMINSGEFIVSCWAGLVYHVTEDGSVTNLVDSREEKINTADIGWNDEERILYVPTFFKNSVVAYQL